MKKLITLLLAAVLCLTMTAPAFADFTDVPSTACYSGTVGD